MTVPMLCERWNMKRQDVRRIVEQMRADGLLVVARRYGQMKIYKVVNNAEQHHNDERPAGESGNRRRAII